MIKTVDNSTTMLNKILKKMACAGRCFTSSNLPAPRYWEMIAEMELRVWPSTQMSMDKNEPTIPAAAKDSKPSTGILPTMAVSVMERMGSAMPEMVAGTASWLMLLKLICVLKTPQVTALIHNNEKDVHFVWERRYRPAFDTPVARKNAGSVCFVRMYPTAPIQSPVLWNVPPQNP